MCSTSFSSHRNPVQYILLFLGFTSKETEARGRHLLVVTQPVPAEPGGEPRLLAAKLLTITMQQLPVSFKARKEEGKRDDGLLMCLLSYMDQWREALCKSF